jgi:hypothetical protein
VPPKGDQYVAAEPPETRPDARLFKRRERGIEHASKWHGSTESSTAQLVAGDLFHGKHRLAV